MSQPGNLGDWRCCWQPWQPPWVGRYAGHLLGPAPGRLLAMATRQPADNQCEAVLDQLGNLGEAGIPAMAEALGSDAREPSPAGRASPVEGSRRLGPPAFPCRLAEVCRTGPPVGLATSLLRPGRSRGGRGSGHGDSPAAAGRPRRQPLGRAGRLRSHSPSNDRPTASVGREPRSPAAGSRLGREPLGDGRGPSGRATGAKGSAGPSPLSPSDTILPDNESLASRNPVREPPGDEKGGHPPFAGTARRVIRTKGDCPLSSPRKPRLPLRRREPGTIPIGSVADGHQWNMVRR